MFSQLNCTCIRYHADMIMPSVHDLSQTPAVPIAVKKIMETDSLLGSSSVAAIEMYKTEHVPIITVTPVSVNRPNPIHLPVTSILPRYSTNTAQDHLTCQYRLAISGGTHRLGRGV